VIAVSGGRGRLGRRLLPELAAVGQVAVGPVRQAVDWSRAEQVRPFLAGLGQAAVVALASYTDVAGAERNPIRCRRDTVTTAAVTAAEAARLGVPLLYVSSDYVVPLERGLDGGAYARAKWEAERAVVAAGGHVVRLAFTTPEQTDGWKWANDYTLSNRWWVEDAARELARFVAAGDWRKAPLHELGPPRALTPAQLLRGRYPDHPALDDLVTEPDEMRRRVGFSAPPDTRFVWAT